MRKPIIHLLFLVISVFCFDETPINVRVLRLAVMHNPPFEMVLAGPNGTNTYVGAGRNALDWLALKLSVTIEFVYPSQEPRPIDLLLQGEADITSTAFVPTTERLKNAEPSTFFAWEEGYRMIVPRPEEELRLFAFIRPFQFSVWLLLVASTVISGLGMSMFSCCYEKILNNKPKKNKCVSLLKHFGNYFTYNINMLTNHGDYLKGARITSFSILASAWLIGASVLVYGYSSVVVSSLTLPLTKPAVNSLEDVLTSKEVSLLLQTGMYPGMLIMNFSEAPLHKALRKKMQQNPEALINDYIALEKLLKTRKYASPQLDSFARFYIGSEYAKDRQCNFKLSSSVSSLPNNYFFRFLQKGNKLLARKVSLRTMELWETGLSRFWVKNSLVKADECFASEINSPLAKQASIKLVDLTSAFFIIGFGICLSILCFLYENLYFKCIPKY